MDISILYKDSAVAVCLKSPGCDCERDMPETLKAQLKVSEVRCVHRLDRDVGGVMVYALDKEAAAALSRAIGIGDFQKEYLAVAHGKVEPEADTLCDLLFHDRTKNKSYVVKRKRAGVKEAALSYRVCAMAEGLSLLAVRLHTGRTHQIRVQFASRRHPLVGDAKYGSPMREHNIALFSHTLGFQHPVTGESMRFESPIPGGYPWDLFDKNIIDGGPVCDTSK